jgi:hypothetical protein
MQIERRLLLKKDAAPPSSGSTYGSGKTRGTGSDENKIIGHGVFLSLVDRAIFSKIRSKKNERSYLGHSH